MDAFLPRRTARVLQARRAGSISNDVQICRSRFSVHPLSSSQAVSCAKQVQLKRMFCQCRHLTVQISVEDHTQAKSTNSNLLSNNTGPNGPNHSKSPGPKPSPGAQRGQKQRKASTGNDDDDRSRHNQKQHSEFPFARFQQPKMQESTSLPLFRDMERRKPPRCRKLGPSHENCGPVQKQLTNPVGKSAPRRELTGWTQDERKPAPRLGRPVLKLLGVPSFSGAFSRSCAVNCSTSTELAEPRKWRQVAAEHSARI